MTAPTHGAVLDAESVKLLLPGDLLTSATDEYHWRKRGATCVVLDPVMMESGLHYRAIRPDGSEGLSSTGDIETFTFLARPTPEGVAKAYLAKFGPVGMNRPKATPPAQPEPGAGELESLIDRLRWEPGDCPFCGSDPYHYVDNGVGMERVAVTCCEEGIALFQYGDAVLQAQITLRSEAADALTQAQAKIARLEGLASTLGDKLVRRTEALEAALIRADRAEADAAKVSEAVAWRWRSDMWSGGGWRLASKTPDTRGYMGKITIEPLYTHPAPTDQVPADVARLVVAARRVAFDDPTQEQLRALDIASEAFASRVPWEDEPSADLKAEAGR